MEARLDYDGFFFLIVQILLLPVAYLQIVYNSLWLEVDLCNCKNMFM